MKERECWSTAVSCDKSTEDVHSENTDIEGEEGAVL
jgi:hypothetical protein